MKRAFQGKLEHSGSGALSIREPTYGIEVVKILFASVEEKEKWRGKTVRVTVEDLPDEPTAGAGDEVTESIKEIAHSITPRRFRLGDDFGPRTGGVLPDNDDWIGPADKKPSNVFIGPGRRRRR